jgi:hypothetical protein
VRRLAVGLSLLAFVLALPGQGGVAGASPPAHFIVGVDDDTARWLARPNGLVAAQRAFGLASVRIMIPWRRGQRSPGRAQQIWLHRVALTAALGQRVVLSVYGRARQAPLDARTRADYCTFVGHVLERIPIEDVVIWNEANNGLFWPPGEVAPYERLLARCWDSLHAARRDVNVIDSTSPHQDPGGFLLELGAVYRASGRTRPIIDTFGHNAYPENSSEPPWTKHTNGSIDEGDYDRLMEVLAGAFTGTPQPLPGGGRTRIWYLEDGFQTRATPEKARLYRGRETDPAPVPALSPGGDGEPDAASTAAPRDQATQLKDAIELAYCQPAVGAFFNFELIDENNQRGWQSGLLWADGTPKPSAAVVRQAVDDAASGSIDCSSLPAG